MFIMEKTSLHVFGDRLIGEVRVKYKLLAFEVKDVYRPLRQYFCPTIMHLTAEQCSMPLNDFSGIFYGCLRGVEWAFPVDFTIH